MSIRWRPRLVALLMGCLVGGYTASLSATMAGLVISALALAIPALISVGVDPRIHRHGLVLACVAAVSLLVGGLVIASAAFPTVWQGYSSSAAFISLVAEMAVTPFAAAFVVGTPRERTQPDWVAWGIGCGVLAWVGVGLQCIVLPYLVPLVRILVPVLIFHQPLPASHGGFSYGWVFVGILLGAALLSLYGILGFGLACLSGILGGGLRRLLSRGYSHRMPG